jgi:hypothetical protein
MVDRNRQVWKGVPGKADEVPSADNAQAGATPYLHLFGTYDVAYAQFH